MLKKNTKIGFLSQDIFRESADRSVVDEMRATLPEITERMQLLETIEQRLEAHDPDSVHLIEQQAEITERLVHEN